MTFVVSLRQNGVTQLGDYILKFTKKFTDPVVMTQFIVDNDIGDIAAVDRYTDHMAGNGSGAYVYVVCWDTDQEGC